MRFLAATTASQHSARYTRTSPTCCSSCLLPALFVRYPKSSTRSLVSSFLVLKPPSGNPQSLRTDQYQRNNVDQDLRRLRACDPVPRPSLPDPNHSSQAPGRGPPSEPFHLPEQQQARRRLLRDQREPGLHQLLLRCATGTAVAGVAGAYVCPTKENDRAVSSWCCSALDHGGPDDGYTLWCEDGVSGQLLDTTSLSLTSVESALASPSLDATAVEDAVAEIQAEILAVEDELNLDTSALDVSAVDSALAELESALAADPSTLDISAVEKLVDEVENALAGSSLDTSAVQSAVAEIESVLASA
ncbi:hypothetical protein M409DRAFT_53755 [Zasmidium cellare ATCC 36951]|uniref:Uncharacterized protein n=1 Tax=Zasmidium cellare ATCC 36951 TaxID=1080233 RepID=A0A6A6CNS8_ZASCE|nr:uncharacterized protein M409DRAFT_53755 [Zasmidium cellare ATCC 36951]KAF2167790.1 hypothetical protein M409DRAFT_53755 [Zasmidium cellare ATCC 36951]